MTYRRNQRQAQIPRATIPAAGLGSMYTWESQEGQYLAIGPPGISYFAGHTRWGVVDCLLHRNVAGRLTGILNYYPTRFPMEEPGNVNLWVSPQDQGQGIGLMLLAEADRRWTIDFTQQSYTEAGRALVVKYLKGRA